MLVSTLEHSFTPTKSNSVKRAAGHPPAAPCQQESLSFSAACSKQWHTSHRAFPISATLQLLSSPDCSLPAWDCLGWFGRGASKQIAINCVFAYLAFEVGVILFWKCRQWQDEELGEGFWTCLKLAEGAWSTALSHALFQTIKRERKRAPALSLSCSSFLSCSCFAWKCKCHPATFLLIGTRLKPSIGWPPVWYLTRKSRSPG